LGDFGKVYGSAQWCFEKVMKSSVEDSVALALREGKKV
jgi:hypothetical protein